MCPTLFYINFIYLYRGPSSLLPPSRDVHGDLLSICLKNHPPPTSCQICFLADLFPTPGIPFPYSISCWFYLSGLRFIVSFSEKPFQTLPVQIMFSLLFSASLYKSHFVLHICLGLIRCGFPSLACEIEEGTAIHRLSGS